MKDNRTHEQKYAAWVAAVTQCHAKGWQHVTEWVFRAPSGSLHDLSAADLTHLSRIETDGRFLVRK